LLVFFKLNLIDVAVGGDVDHQIKYPITLVDQLIFAMRINVMDQAVKLYLPMLVSACEELSFRLYK
jgi:hypothetical protein